jgi:hypothetical protein
MNSPTMHNSAGPNHAEFPHSYFACTQDAIDQQLWDGTFGEQYSNTFDSRHIAKTPIGSSVWLNSTLLASSTRCRSSRKPRHYQSNAEAGTDIFDYIACLYTPRNRRLMDVLKQQKRPLWSKQSGRSRSPARVSVRPDLIDQTIPRQYFNNLIVATYYIVLRLSEGLGISKFFQPR